MEKSFKIGDIIAVIFRFLVAGVFLYAGSIKVLDPAQFAQDINGFHLIPFWLSAVLSAYIPSLEIALAVCLMTRKLYEGTILLLLTLITFFIVAISSVWIRGIDISCGCFGSPHHSNYFWLLFRDVILLAAVLFLFLRTRTQTDQ